ncbi:hypothetical protein A2U01_0119604, partial [Trifolium medium]|nr:hypothetical protein [Trifolium medium]
MKEDNSAQMKKAATDAKAQGDLISYLTKEKDEAVSDLEALTKEKTG